VLAQHKFVALQALVALVTLASSARAVDCPSAQQLTSSNGFGQSVAMYNDQVTGEYLIVSSSNGTYYYEKPVGSSAGFPTTPTLVDSIGGNLAVQVCAIIVGGQGQVNVYQQARDSTGSCVGPPFNHVATLTPSPPDPTGTFGQSLSYDENANFLVACSSQSCWAFGQEGNAGWVQTSPGVISSGYAATLDGLGYLAMLQSKSSLQLFTYTWTSTPPVTASWTQFQQITPPAQRMFAGLSQFWDRVYMGVVPSGGASGPGVVNTYSNNSLTPGGAAWASWSNLQFTAAQASPQFGAAIANSGDYLLVSDPGGPSGPTIYQYRIVHQQMGVTNLPTDTVMEIGAGTPTFGTAIDVDALCGAVGSPSNNTVELFPVNQPMPTLCCAATSGSTIACPTQMGASCPSSSAPITAQIPAIGGASSATIFLDPNCNPFQPGLQSLQASTCATITFAGDILGPATVCFPDVGATQIVDVCDAVPSGGLCTGVNTTVQKDSSNGQKLCCRTYTGQKVGGVDCINVTHFSSFASAQKSNWVDTDGDTVPSMLDNCPLVSNVSQADQDRDLIGDVCDNCPAVPNQDQKNTTGASVGDACNCALPGVTRGPSGAPCTTAVPAPAVPRTWNLLLGGLLLGLGAFAAGGGWKALRRLG
jgi:hypothetical protein